MAMKQAFLELHSNFFPQAVQSGSCSAKGTSERTFINFRIAWSVALPTFHIKQTVKIVGISTSTFLYSRTVYLLQTKLFYTEKQLDWNIIRTKYLMKKAITQK